MALKRHHQRPNIARGFHAVEAVVKRNREQVVEVIINRRRTDPRTKKMAALLEKSKVSFRFSTREEAETASDGVNDQGIVAILKAHVKSRPPAKGEQLEMILNGLTQGLVLVLDHIQDPRNLGACLRCAECAGVDAVIVPRAGASPVNDTVRKAASGAVENVNMVYVANVAQTLKKLQRLEYWIIGAAEQGKMTLYDCDFSGNIAIVMGAEGKGLRRLTAQHCDYLAKIPMLGAVSSLNVSVAAGVFLFEAMRQRRRASG
ncbi:23S rRNA (guanosine(2251)-2'-O)-methyltransferase RlmB [Candidatus Spongiihabitans sp.]|uniref:23S rRNA (guanosine(2251)-2'-O)-methyltransferase RlmB n=1 Tax=Candidatus Spongiihabitans sp. TaxID=3101308 RepID=UPI003C7A2153